MAENPNPDENDAPSEDSFQPSEGEDEEPQEPVEPARKNDAQPEAPIEPDVPGESDEPDEPENEQPEFEKLPFGFERPIGQPVDEFSRTYTLKDLRRHLLIDARIQALIMEDIESYVHYGRRADPAAIRRQYITWIECPNEPRAAICNDLGQMGFSMDIVRAVFDGQFAKGHTNRATGYFLYQHYPAVKKRIGQRKKRRRSGLAAEGAVVAEDKVVSEAAMEKIIEQVIARTAPEVTALTERVELHQQQLEKNDQHLRENDKQLRKQARRIQKHADRLATIDGNLTAIRKSGVETERGIGKLMEMMAAKV